MNSGFLCYNTYKALEIFLGMSLFEGFPLEFFHSLRPGSSVGGQIVLFLKGFDGFFGVFAKVPICAILSTGIT